MRVASCIRVVAAAAVLAGCGSEGEAKSPEPPKERPRGVVVDCHTRSEFAYADTFPHAYTNPDNVVVGPLVLVGAADTPADVVREFGGDKVAVLLRPRHRVTVALSKRTRRGAGLAYGPLPEGRNGIEDAHRVVTFRSCRKGESRSAVDGKPVTFWMGFVMAVSPRCVPIEVWVDDEPKPHRRTLRMGVPSCP
ncbi:MAG TPA: hypothetical protein VGW10_01350 [Solirubrobacteraceae bacterium]|nr:hypothetical protein [Solirubrobacteraceae bacterium]